MSIFKKVIASIGIGSATVDTKLKNNYIIQGELVEGVIEITGGSTDQKIDSINLKLMTIYGHEDSDRLTPTIIQSHKVNDPFIISKGENKSIKFAFRVPLDTPITMIDPRTHKNVPPVWIDTDLDIKSALDPKDRDYISVEPTKGHEKIIDAIKIIGFRFRQMENQQTPYGIKTNRPYVQQYEFFPTYGKYSNKLDELEIYILQSEEETTIYFEVDKKSKGAFAALKEKLDLDEHRGSITFNNEEILKNPQLVSERFEQIIDQVL